MGDQTAVLEVEEENDIESTDLDTANTADEYIRFPARATLDGKASKSQLALITEHINDPSIMDEKDLFVWRAIVSNTKVDAYFTHMHESSLRNYAAEAKAGLSFMNSHRTGGRSMAELPMGRSFDGKYIAGSDKRVEESFYTFRGLKLNDLPTDDFIDGLRSGIVSDVSIGFYGGKYICDICNRDWYNDWDCIHWPGVEYSVKDKDGNDTGEVIVATLAVHNAHQAEVSSVYDGATPGAMIIRAQNMTDAGLIKPDVARILEMRYRIKLPIQRQFAGVDSIPKKGHNMGEQDRVSNNEGESAMSDKTPTPEPVGRSIHDEVLAKLDGLRDNVADVLKRAGAPEGANLEWFVTEMNRLRPLVDEGKAYRASLIDEAMTEGKRAHGNDFGDESYRGILATAPLETIKRMRDDWKTIADKTFAPGGRVTREQDERVTADEDQIPDSAFKVRA